MCIRDRYTSRYFRPPVFFPASSRASSASTIILRPLSKVKLNQEVSIKLSEYGDKTFKGKVVLINKNADFAMKKATKDVYKRQELERWLSILI